VKNVRHGVPDIQQDRPAGSVNVSFAVRVKQIDSLAMRDHWMGVVHAPVKNMSIEFFIIGHG
jgi:hypothetical protein